VQQAFVEQHLHERQRMPPIFDEVVHHVFAAGLEVGQHGHLLPMR
jgi:hypothetical protein